MAAAGRVGAAAKVVDVPDAGVVVQAYIALRRDAKTRFVRNWVVEYES